LQNGRASSRSNTETVTVEVLNRLIKENPQNMTQAIRAWLQDSSKPKN